MAVRFRFLVASTLALACLAARADTVVFPELISFDEILTAGTPLDSAFYRQEADAHARAAALPASPAPGAFELRIWRTDMMHGDGIGYVIANDRLRVFETRRDDGTGHVRARRIADRRLPADRLPVAELRALKSLSGRWYGCMVVDGESVLIQAWIDGVAVQLDTGNPTACRNASLDRIAALLGAVDALGGHHGVQASVMTSY